MKDGCRCITQAADGTICCGIVLKRKNMKNFDDTHVAIRLKDKTIYFQIDEEKEDDWLNGRLIVVHAAVYRETFGDIELSEYFTDLDLDREIWLHLDKEDKPEKICVYNVKHGKLEIVEEWK